MGIKQSTGSSLWMLHHLTNNFHLLSYLSRVGGALAFRMVRLTGSAQLLNPDSGLSWAKHVNGDGEDWDAKPDLLAGTTDLSC